MEIKFDPTKLRIGLGYDVHAFAQERKLILGGILIPYHLGLMGHSDADVLVHAIMDSILGACSLGDIGRHFPDNQSEFQGIDSFVLLKRVMEKMYQAGWEIINLDNTIVCQAPKLFPYIPQMVKKITDLMNLKENQVSIKATTTEGLGFVGRNEGIAVQSVVLLYRL